MHSGPLYSAIALIEYKALKLPSYIFPVKSQSNKSVMMHGSFFTNQFFVRLYSLRGS